VGRYCAHSLSVAATSCCRVHLGSATCFLYPWKNVGRSISLSPGYSFICHSGNQLFLLTVVTCSTGGPAPRMVDRRSACSARRSLKICLVGSVVSSMVVGGGREGGMGCSSSSSIICWPSEASSLSLSQLGMTFFCQEKLGK